MNVLPQAIANGRNQNGTIAGKLNGTIAAQTPTGWRIVSASIAARHVLEHAALHGRRDRAGGLDHLDHARDLGAGVGDRLAHLGRHRARQLLAAGVERPRAGRTACAPARSRDTSRQAGSAARAACTAASRSAALDSGTRASTSPVAGFVTSSWSRRGGRASTIRRCSCRAGGWRCGDGHGFSVHSWSGSLAMAQLPHRTGHHVQVVDGVARAARRPCGSRAARARRPGRARPASRRDYRRRCRRAGARTPAAGSMRW